MTKEEYRLARNVWIRRQYDAETSKPSDLLEHWIWYVAKEREFRQLLQQKGITISNK